MATEMTIIGIITEPASAALAPSPTCRKNCM